MIQRLTNVARNIGRLGVFVAADRAPDSKKREQCEADDRLMASFDLVS